MTATEKAYREETLHLLQTLHRHGFTVSEVDNGEEATKFDNGRTILENADSIIDEAMACDEARVIVRHKDMEKRAVLFLVYGNGRGELVCDYSDTPLLSKAMDEIHHHYFG